MSFNYPVCLNLQQKKCVVIGGGSVAKRKVAALLAQEAAITVIAPAVCEEIAQKAAANELLWRNTYFTPQDLAGAFLVIAATDNREVNHEAAEYCREHNILINVCDSLEESSFIVNSYFTKGDLLVAVSTGGASPALSRKLRLDLQQMVDDKYAEVLEILCEARKQALIKITDSSKRREFLQSLAKIDYLKILEEQSADNLRNQVKQCLSSYLD